MSLAVIGLDPGLASFGYCVARVAGSSVLVSELGVWRTKPNGTKSAVRSSSSVAERNAYLYRELVALFDREPAGLLCLEDFSPPRSAGPAAKVARVFGMLDAVAAYEGLGTLRATPQEIKLATTGKRSASKEAVEESVRAVCTPRALKGLEASVPRSQWNHAFDAGGSVIACVNHPEMRMMIGRASS